MANKIVYITCRDATLKSLLEEQVLCRKIFGLGSPETADIVVTDNFSVNQNAKKLLVVTPPLRLGEVMDRLRYALSGRDRHTNDWGKDPLDMGKYSLCAEENLLLHKESGKSLRLTDKERLLLKTLFEAEGHRMGRKSLLQEVWGYAEHAETHTLETHLYRLRQKLQEFGEPELVISEDGTYRLSLS